MFLDRDGNVFGHVLEYLRDGVVSVAEAGAAQSGDIGLLHRLKREFGFFAIELFAEKQGREEVAFAVGRKNVTDGCLSSVECYDAASDTWRAVSAMGEARYDFAMCELAGECTCLAGSMATLTFCLRWRGTRTRLTRRVRWLLTLDEWSTLAPMP